MQKTQVEIQNELGLHARASAKLSQLASQFKSEIWLARNGKRVNAKSIMGVMMLAAAKGVTIQVETIGTDEEAALAALVQLIESRFGELA